jgi:hypothetical protein
VCFFTRGSGNSSNALSNYWTSYNLELRYFSAIYDSVSSGKNIKLVINFDDYEPKLPVVNQSSSVCPLNTTVKVYN